LAAIRHRHHELLEYLMDVIVNGEQRNVRPGSTVEELIEQLGLRSQPCAAEVNGTLVQRANRPDRVLSPGDRIEIVTLVGGG